ncbi:MAG: DUF4197 domain-containing protein [Bacteroidales bacterium]|nr:DUF4197 domain-containing protein [Bacteroidales bacterium]
MKKILAFFIVIFMLSSCEILEQLLQQSAGSLAPTETEVVQGLKKALELGTDYAVTSLNKKDGYFGNPKVKIPLPDDVNNVFSFAMNNNTVKKLGFDKILQKKIDDVILAINRSAEEAAREAKPIFVNTLTNMTISDGMNILKGNDVSKKVSGFDSLAATHYLDFKTRNQLFNLYQPKVNTALSKDLGLGFSANDAWETVIKYYNSIIAPVLGKPTIDYSLSDFATTKALDGMFYMIGQEEKNIRQDPFKWAIDIIKKVFGYVHQ